MKPDLRHPVAAAEKILDAACLAIEKREVDHCAIDDFLDFVLPCPEFRRTVSDLLFAFYRNRAYVDEVWSSLVRRPPRARVRYLLQAATAQILFQSAIAPASAVNVAVSLARRRGNFGEGAFVNAVLRKVVSMPRRAAPATPLEIFPAPVLRVLMARYADRAAVEAATHDFLQPAPFVLRCALGFDFSAEEREALKLEEVTPAFDGCAFRFYRSPQPAKVLIHSGLAGGKFYIQDSSTALALAGKVAAPGARFLDLCAAPGGKALQFAELAGEGARIVAADRSARRQKLTRNNFERRSLPVEIEVAAAWELSEKLGLFDCVLADVPCSNSGVYRRRPDAMWDTDAGKIAELNVLQKAIVRGGARFVAPGGLFIYSTCSICEAEDEAIVREFLAQHADFVLEGENLLLPGHDHDGAYRALLRRK